MIFQWILATIMLIMAAFLFGLSVMIFIFYARKKHKYLLHIALMSSGQVMFTFVIIAQLIAGMFKSAFPQIIVIPAIFLSLGLSIGGLARMWWHRHREHKLQR